MAIHHILLFDLGLDINVTTMIFLNNHHVIIREIMKIYRKKYDRAKSYADWAFLRCEFREMIQWLTVLADLPEEQVWFPESMLI